MYIIVLLFLFYFTTPLLLIYLTHISKTISKIGSVVLAYSIGLLIGNTGIFPRASESFKTLLAGRAFMPDTELSGHIALGQLTSSDITLNQISSIQDIIMSISIPIALPLLLFSLDIKKWLKLAKEAFLSLVLGVVSLLIVVIAGFFLLKNHIPESWKVAGLLCGVYTGGTPNLAAIGTALDVSPNIFVLTHTYDLVIGSICLIFLITIAQRVFNLILPHFNENHEHIRLKKLVSESEGIDNYMGMLNRKGIIQLVKALGISILILAVSFGISTLVPKPAQTAVIILSITTLGLLLGLVKSISKIEKTFQFGMYFIIVFSLVVSSMADLRSMFQIDFLHLFLFVAIAVFGSIIIHVGLSYIFRVDTDTTIITITALAFSPPFVPVVAAALKNKEVIITGITSGILGYAFGNYLGVGIAYLLKGFL